MKCLTSLIRALGVYTNMTPEKSGVVLSNILLKGIALGATSNIGCGLVTTTSISSDANMAISSNYDIHSLSIRTRKLMFNMSVLNFSEMLRFNYSYLNFKLLVCRNTHNIQFSMWKECCRFLVLWQYTRQHWMFWLIESPLALAKMSHPSWSLLHINDFPWEKI